MSPSPGNSQVVIELMTFCLRPAVLKIILPNAGCLYNLWVTYSGDQKRGPVRVKLQHATYYSFETVT